MRAHAAILDAWMQKTCEIYPEPARDAVSRSSERFRHPVGFAMRESLAKVVQELAGKMDVVRVAAAMEQIVRLRAVQDYTPGEAVCFVFLLRKIIRELKAEDQFPDLERRIDDLALITFDLYVRCREDLALLRVNEAKRALSLRQRMREEL
jgi:hypothetical protein